jgi:hypothetical protein
MTLEHCRTRPVEFFFECRDQPWMIVTNIVNAISGNKIDDRFVVRGMKLRPATTDVIDVHLQDIEQANPLRIDVLFVGEFSVTSKSPADFGLNM